MEIKSLKGGQIFLIGVLVVLVFQSCCVTSQEVGTYPYAMTI